MRIKILAVYLSTCILLLVLLQPNEHYVPNLPTPDFLMNVHPAPQSQISLDEFDMLYFEINEFPIWEPGDGHNLTPQIVDSLVVELNGHTLGDLDMFQPQLMIGMYENGELSGFMSGPITVWKEDIQLEYGTNSFFVGISSTSGKRYTYYWTIEVN